MSGGVLDAIIKSANDFLATRPAAVQTRDLISGRKNAQLQKLLKEAAIRSNQSGELSKSTITNLLKHGKNVAVFGRWIVSDIDSNNVALDSLEVDSCLNSYDERAAAIKFLCALHSNIQLGKLEHFDPADLAQLAQGRQILQRTENIEAIRADTAATKANTAATKDDVAAIRAMVQDWTSSNLYEPSSTDGAIERNLRQLVDNRHYTAARDLASEKLNELPDRDGRRAIFLLRIMVNSCIRKGQKEEAVPYLQQLIAITKDDIELLHSRLLLEQIAGDLDAARRLALKLLEHPRIGAPQKLLVAETLIAVGDPDMAIGVAKSVESVESDASLAIQAMALAVSGRLPDAQQKLIPHASNPPKLTLVDEVLLRVEVALFDQAIATTDQISESILKKAHEINARIDAFARALSEDELPRLSHALVQMAHVYSLIGKAKQGFDLMQKRIRLEGIDTEDLPRAAQIAATADELKASDQLFNRQIELNHSSYDSISHGSVMLGLAQYDRLIAHVDAEIGNATDKFTEVQLLALKVAALDHTFATTKAQETLDAMHSRFPEYTAEVALASARHLRMLETEASDVVQQYQIASRSSVTAIANVAQVELAFYYRTIGDIDSRRQAFLLLKQFASPTRRDNVLDTFIDVARELDELDVAVSFAQESIRLNGFSESAYLAMAAALLQREEFGQAIEYLELLSQKYRQNISYAINLAVCYDRTGRSPDALDVLLQTQEHVDTAGGFMNIALAFLRAGHNKEAVQAAYAALQLSANDPLINQDYMWIGLHAEDGLQLAGEKCIQAYQQILRDFEKRFPDSNVITTIKAPSDPDELAVVLNRAMGDATYRSIITKELYLEHRLPVSWLAYGWGQDLVTLWVAVTSDSSIPIWLNPGDSQQHEMRAANANSPTAILIDLVSVLLAVELPGFREAIRQYDKVYICQSTLDMLAHQELLLRKPPAGYLSPTIDGRVAFRPAEKSVLNRQTRLVNEAISLVTSGDPFTLVGRSSKRRDKDLEPISETLGQHVLDPIFESEARDVPCVLVDWYLGQLARSWGVASIGVQSVLCATNNPIETEVQLNDLVTLIRWKTVHVAISAELLSKAVLWHVGNPANSRGITLLDALRDRELDLSSVIRVASDFLAWLWQEQFLTETKEMWTHSTLFAICSNRRQTVMTNKVLAGVTARISDLNPLPLMRFSECVDAWLKANRSN